MNTSIRLDRVLVGLLLSAMGVSPVKAQTLRLEDLERMALESHPSIAQAEAGVRAAAGRARQAGLYPNPVVGVTGDEIAAGPIIRGGEVGGFFEQRIVTARKLGLSRNTAVQEQREAQEQVAAQRQRVLNTVRILYYQALGEQRLLEVRKELAQLAGRVAATSRELSNIGQADQPDVLAADVEAERLELGLVTAENALERTWRQIAAAVNKPALTSARLEGNLEPIPKLDAEAALARIFAESPELKIAQVSVARSEFALRRAQVEKIPDIVMRGGVRYNRELLEIAPGGGPRPVGKEGFFDIGVELPIFNRNQGQVAAAKAELERARLEVDRNRLALRNRLAAAHKEYRDAIAAVERYRDRMIPKAKRAFELYTANFRQMAATYPQVLMTERSYVQLREDYIAALVMAWQRSVEIEGLLLTEDMMMPGGVHGR